MRKGELHKQPIFQTFCQSKSAVLQKYLRLGSIMMAWACFATSSSVYETLVMSVQLVMKGSVTAPFWIRLTVPQWASVKLSWHVLGSL